MNIVCSKCQGKFTIPAEKIPTSATAHFKCPRCGNRLSVGPEKKKAPERAEGIGNFGFEEEEVATPSISFDEGEAVEDYDNPFDFVEEEGLTALICENNPEVQDKIKISLDLMEYSVKVAANTRDALRNLRYHVYDVVVINESFDALNPESNGILIYLNRLNISIRRNMTVFLITEKCRTHDNMAALDKSVNMVVNVNDIEMIDSFLERGYAENDMFYRIYKEYLTKAGRG